MLESNFTTGQYTVGTRWAMFLLPALTQQQLTCEEGLIKPNVLSRVLSYLLSILPLKLGHTWELTHLPSGVSSVSRLSNMAGIHTHIHTHT